MDLLERDHYFEQLSEFLQEASAGHGWTVLISGEAGIGKTALVEQFVSQSRGVARSLWGACEALFTPRPLGPLHDIAIQVQGNLLTLIAHNAERPLVFSTLIEEFQKSPLPTIVVFEDIHWADEATLDLIKFLGRRILHLPVLFLVTYRDNELDLDHPLRSVIGDLPGNAVARLQLIPLSETAVIHLAKQAHRSADQLYAITGGNPFFVTEVLASDMPGVPLMVRDAVFARLARLSPAARVLLELVSVIPTRSERRLLETVLDSAASALEECLASGMLSVDQTTVAFRHELARQAIESTLSPLRQQALHTKVLQAFLVHVEDTSQAARLVHHALGAHKSELVVRYAPLAAQQASAQGAHREAAAQYATALLFADQSSPERKAELLDGRAYECYLTNQIEEAVQASQASLQIWRQLDRSERVGQTLLWLSRLSWHLGQSGAAEQYAAEVVDLLEAFPSDARLAMAYSNRAHLAMLADKTGEAVCWSEQALLLAESVGDDETLVHALNNLGTALLTAQDERGRAHLERSLQLALERGWEDHVARAYTNLADCAAIARDYAQAEPLLREGIAYCARHDLDNCGAYLEAYLAHARFEQGHWDEAAEEVTRILNHYRHSTVLKIPALVVLGMIQVRRGDPGIWALLDEARTLALPTGEPQRIVPVAVARAEAAWLSGNLEQCLAEIQEGYNLVQARTDPWRLGALSVWMWRAGGLTGEPGSIAEPFARQIAGDWREAAELWAHIGCPYEQALALADGDRAAQQEALTLLERLGARPALALLRQRLRQQGVTGFPRGPRPSTRSNPAGLTSRQMEVLRLMAEGLSNAEIAGRLFTSPKTIEHHVSSVLAKLGGRTRAQAISAAYHMQLLSTMGEPQA